MKSPRISAGTIIVSLFPDTSSVIFTTFPRAFSFKSRKNTFRSARIFSVCSKSLSTCPLSLISTEYFPLNRPKGQTQKIKTRRMLKPMELYFFPRIPMPNAAPAACARRGLRTPLRHGPQWSPTARRTRSSTVLACSRARPAPSLRTLST